MENTNGYCQQTGKVCYRKKEAETIVNYARRPFNRVIKRGRRVHCNSYSGKIPKRIYCCEFCGWWHVTSQKKHKTRNDYDNRY